MTCIASYNKYSHVQLLTVVHTYKNIQYQDPKDTQINIADLRQITQIASLYT